jgi:hypothetical protein
LWDFSKRPARWPNPSEIATQYVVICLLEMKVSRSLRLPFHAATCLPVIMDELRRELPPQNAEPLMFLEQKEG